MTSAGNFAQALPDFSEPESEKPVNADSQFNLLTDAPPGATLLQFEQWPNGSEIGPEPMMQPDLRPAEALTEQVEFTVPETPAEPETDPLEPLRQEHAAEIERLKAQHADELERLRETIADEQIQSLSNSLLQLETRLADELEQRVAGTLGQIIGESIADESLIMLCKWLKVRLGTAGVAEIQISGPKSLTDRIIKPLGPQAEGIVVVENDAVDIQIVIGDEAVTTRLGEWREMVLGCMS